jgi:hypothetical protein
VSAAFGGQCQGVSSSSSTSTVLHSPACPTSLGSSKIPIASDLQSTFYLRLHHGRSDKWGCLATIEVAPERETPINWPPKAGSPRSLRNKMMRRTLSGQPDASAAPTPPSIRVSDRGRHEHRNRIKLFS